MIKRLKLVGWIILMIIMACVTIASVLLSPIWVFQWLIWGKFVPYQIYKWVEDTFPPEVTS